MHLKQLSSRVRGSAITFVSSDISNCWKFCAACTSWWLVWHYKVSGGFFFFCSLALSAGIAFRTHFQLFQNDIDPSKWAHCVFYYSHITPYMHIHTHTCTHAHGRMIMVQPDNLIIEYSACRVNGPQCQGRPRSPPPCPCNSTLSKSKKM